MREPRAEGEPQDKPFPVASDFVDSLLSHKGICSCFFRMQTKLSMEERGLGVGGGVVKPPKMREPLARGSPRPRAAKTDLSLLTASRKG